MFWHLKTNFIRFLLYFESNAFSVQSPRAQKKSRTQKKMEAYDKPGKKQIKT